ncbi:MAG TPA: hypothetical protein VFY69_09400 [Solirubrobacterales bacterium]|nr:hypothetical protein [Solirubrobacterales bacterium]
MKYLKMSGLLAAAIAALLALAGTASATITSPAGTAYSGTIEATSTNNEFDFTVDMKCGHSAFAATITEGATSGPVTDLSFGECGSDTITVLNNGTLSIASDGTVNLGGAEFTWTWHRNLFGFPVTFHCIYAFGSIGTLTEGATPAVIHSGSSELQRKTTDSGCGETAIWTGTYTVSEPAGAITVD